MQDGFIGRSLPSNAEPESPGKESQGCPTLSSIVKATSGPLTGVRLKEWLNARRIHRSLTKQHTYLNQQGMESQGYPTVRAVKHIQSPHNSLEGVTLNAIRISSFTAKQHTTRIIKVRSHKAAPTVHAVRRIRVNTLPLKE